MHHFNVEIRMFEVLVRPLEVRREQIPSLPLSGVAEKQVFRKRHRHNLDDGEGILTSQCSPEIRGHTSYLTFATLIKSQL